MFESMNSTKSRSQARTRGIHILTVVDIGSDRPTIFARAAEKDELEAAVGEAVFRFIPGADERIADKTAALLRAGKPAWLLDEYCFEWYEV